MQLVNNKCFYALCKKTSKVAAKKCFGFVCRKTPLALVLFMIDKSAGGTEYAINEFLWPVSETWRDDNMWDDDDTEEPVEPTSPTPTGPTTIWPLPPGGIPGDDDWSQMLI